MDDLEAAWSVVHDATPAGWSVMRPSRHDEERERPWHVEATGRTESEALRDLAELLRGWTVEPADGLRS